MKEKNANLPDGCRGCDTEAKIRAHENRCGLQTAVYDAAKANQKGTTGMQKMYFAL